MVHHFAAGPAEISEIASVTEPTADNGEIPAADIPISTGSVKISPNGAKFRSIFSETEISRYADGSVVVCKTAAEKELFPVVQDVKFFIRAENRERYRIRVHRVFVYRKTSRAWPPDA